MNLIVRRYDELTREELYAILRLRIAVFVVEQNCPYQEADGLDEKAAHLWLEDERGIHAYLRVLPPGVAGEEAAIGRVLAVERRQGLASRIVAEGLRIAKELYGAETVRIEAQTYARSLYEKLGFQQTSEEFLLDGIPHIEMRWAAEQNPESAGGRA